MTNDGICLAWFNHDRGAHIILKFCDGPDVACFTQVSNIVFFFTIRSFFFSSSFLSFIFLVDVLTILNRDQ